MKVISYTGALTLMKLIGFVGIVMLLNNAIAEEKQKKNSLWSNEAELGIANTTGNTDTSSTAAKLSTTYESEHWRNNINMQYYSQTTKDPLTGEFTVSAERHQLRGKTDRKFGDYNYIFGLTDLQKDRFSGFAYEYVLAAGYGRKLLDDETMELDIEIGPGLRFYREENVSESEDEAVLHYSLNYRWQFTQNAKLIQSLKTDLSEEFTSSESMTALQAGISNALALKITHTIRHKSEVPVDTQQTDTETAVTLVFVY